MEIEAQQLKLGATGAKPLPPVSRDDEGEIQLAVSGDALHRKVFLNFGKPIAWVGLTAEQAMDVGLSLIEQSRRIRGISD
jgi:hypothetical protein